MEEFNLEIFKKFVEERKFTNHDVAFFIGFSSTYVYTVFNGTNKFSKNFALRALSWMRDELEKERLKGVHKSLVIKARNKVLQKEPKELAEIPLKQRIILNIQQLKEMVEAL
jgi:hypothetical protein